MSAYDELNAKPYDKMTPLERWCVEACCDDPQLVQEQEQACQELLDMRARIATLEEAITEARDLARTGLPPTNIPPDWWPQHKLNRIAATLTAKLEAKP